MILYNILDNCAANKGHEAINSSTSLQVVTFLKNLTSNR